MENVDLGPNIYVARDFRLLVACLAAAGTLDVNDHRVRY